MKNWTYSSSKKFKKSVSKDEKIVLENPFDIFNDKKSCHFDLEEKIKLGKILFESYPSIKVI